MLDSLDEVIASFSRLLASADSECVTPSEAAAIAEVFKRMGRLAEAGSSPVARSLFDAASQHGVADGAGAGAGTRPGQVVACIRTSRRSRGGPPDGPGPTRAVVDHRVPQDHVRRG